MLLDKPEGKPDDKVAWGSDIAAQMLRYLQAGIRMVPDERQKIFAPDVCQLARLQGFHRDLVRPPRQHRIQSQNFPWLRDLQN